MNSFTNGILGSATRPLVFKGIRFLTPDSQGKQEMQKLLVPLNIASRHSELLVPISIFLRIQFSEKGRARISKFSCMKNLL